MTRARLVMERRVRKRIKRTAEAFWKPLVTLPDLCKAERPMKGGS